jgi:hypothetical protein
MDLILTNRFIRQFDSDPEATGGRFMKKAPEPCEVPHETPVVQEMRHMHLDFVEEAYWKRSQAV